MRVPKVESEEPASRLAVLIDADNAKAAVIAPTCRTTKQAALFEAKK